MFIEKIGQENYDDDKNLDIITYLYLIYNYHIVKVNDELSFTKLIFDNFMQFTFDNYLDLKNKEINSQEFKEAILRKIKIAYKNAIQYAASHEKININRFTSKYYQY